MKSQLLIPRAAAALIVLATAFLAGCGSSGPPRAAIHGQVNAGGQPLAAGRILFTPVAPSQGPTTSARIDHGAYQLTAKEGPVVGTNLVQIEADLNLGFELDDEAAFAARGGAPLPPQPIPPEFNSRSTQIVEVKADEDNSYDVTIPQVQQMASGGITP
jgi:hypothetical protein